MEHRQHDPSLKHLSPRSWLDEKMIQTFSVYYHDPLIDMTDEDIERLYQLLKKYKHKLLKERQGQL